jgi:hypothetical protein
VPAGRRPNDETCSVLLVRLLPEQELNEKQIFVMWGMDATVVCSVNWIPAFAGMTVRKLAKFSNATSA